MEARRIAIVLIALGVLFLVARLTGDAGWLWTLLAGGAFLAAYARQGGYGLLLVGGVLTGLAVGLLLGGWGWPGAFPISIGAGLLAVDRLEPRPEAATRAFGIALLVLGAVWGLLASGAMLSTWVGLLLIVVGAALLWRRAAPDRAAGAAPEETTVVWEGDPNAPRRRYDDPVPPAAESVPSDPDPAPPGGSPAEAGDREQIADRRAALERWRAGVAEREDRPEPLVLPDETLDALAEARPSSREALTQVRGIGPVRLDRYGDELIDVLREA